METFAEVNKKQQANWITTWTSFDSLVDWLHGSWTFNFGPCHVFTTMTNGVRTSRPTCPGLKAQTVPSLEVALFATSTTPPPLSEASPH